MKIRVLVKKLDGHIPSALSLRKTNSRFSPKVYLGALSDYRIQKIAPQGNQKQKIADHQSASFFV